MSDYLSNPDEAKEYLPRYPIIYGVVGLAFFTFFVRLWYLQIMQGAELRQFSEKNRIKEEKVAAPRGMILDREGRVLVDNHPGFDAVITPQYASHLEETSEAAGKVLGIPGHVIVKKVQKSRWQNGAFMPVRIKENVNRDEVAGIERLRLDHPGLTIDMNIRRSYLLKDNGAQLFGYVGEISKEELPKFNKGLAPDQRFEQGDFVGKSGLEQFQDRVLRGIDGLRFLQVDAHGREITSATPNFLENFDKTQEAIPGHSLQLTVDRDLQAAAYEAFNKQGKIGALVGMDPTNGEILVWANAPSYDPNEFSTGISPKIWSDLVNDPFKPLRNKIIQDHVPPGSTFKAIVAIAGLSEGVINANTTYFCPGFLKFGKRAYHCHLERGHGSVNVVHALEQSCDVFFYRVGIALGIDAIAKYARALGLGSKVEIDLQGEVSGLMPTSEWKKKTLGEEWQPGENLSNAIGQGFVLATPLQVVQAFSGIAREGLIYKPRLIKRILNTDGTLVEETKPILKEHLGNGPQSPFKIKPEVFALVKEGLKLVVNGSRGTAGRSRLPGVEMSGKTGTVQLFSLAADQVFKKCINRPLQQRHHGWFAAYAPSDNPQIAMAVLAEHACSGSGGAAPVAKEVMLAYFKKYHPEMLKASTKMAITPLDAPVPQMKKPAATGPDVED